MNENMNLADLCQAIYERSGQDAVLNYTANYVPHVPWEWCEPCEHESPVWEKSCLVCGTTSVKEVA